MGKSWNKLGMGGEVNHRVLLHFWLDFQAAKVLVEESQSIGNFVRDGLDFDPGKF